MAHDASDEIPAGRQRPSGGAHPQAPERTRPRPSGGTHPQAPERTRPRPSGGAHPQAPERTHLVLYDPDCGLCKWCTALLLSWDRAGRLAPLALGTPRADQLLGDLTRDQRIASWHLIGPGGERQSGGAALAAVAALAPGGRLPGAVLAALPGFTERAYRIVAAHRSTLSKLVPAAAKARAAAKVAALGGQACAATPQPPCAATPQPSQRADAR